MRKYMYFMMLGILVACADGGGTGDGGPRMRRYSKAEVVAYSNAVVTGMQGAVSNSAERTQYAREHTGNPKASGEAEFQNMYDLLMKGEINGDDITEKNFDAWRRALQMAGCDVDEIDSVDGLREFVNGNAADIRDKASSVYEDNKLTETTIDSVSFDVTDYGPSRATMGSFTFSLDEDGRIQGISYGPDSVLMRAGESSLFAASELGQLVLVWQRDLAITNEEIAGWIADSATEADVARALQNKIKDFVAKNRYRSDLQGLIDRLREYETSDKQADFAYTDIKLGGTLLKNKLSFADFGIVREYDAPGGASLRDGTVIGGYADKRVAAGDIEQAMTFNGAAIGIVSSGDDKMEVIGNASFTFDPTADGGAQSDLHAQFKGWHTVDVHQNGDVTEFDFSGDVDEKWRFAGDGAGGMRSEFYGEGTASEVVGETWYNEEGKSFQGAFGGVKK